MNHDKASTLNLPASTFRLPASTFKLQPSNFKLQPSAFNIPASECCSQKFLMVSIRVSGICSSGSSSSSSSSRNHYSVLSSFHPSSFILHPSSFILQPSTFNLHHSTFNRQPSTFNLHPHTSPFNMQLLEVGSGYYVLEVGFRGGRMSYPRRIHFSLYLSQHRSVSWTIGFQVFDYSLGFKLEYSGRFFYENHELSSL